MLRLFSVLFALNAIAGQAATETRPAPTATLARDGKAQMTIVLAPDSTEAQQQAAKVLATTLEQITGATFTVGTGTDKQGIVLGTLAQFPDDALRQPLEIRHHYDGLEAFVIRTEPQRIRLIANTDLGVSHVVHRFLELLGCRWFFMADTWTIIPESPTLTVALDEDSRPDILSRNIWFSRLAQGMEPGDPSAKELYRDWAIHNRMAQSFRVKIAHAWHKIPKIMATDFDGHPEYLALVEGKRQGPQFCVSNPGLQAAIVAYTRQVLDSDATTDTVSLDPADTSGWCTCADCTALGHHSVQPFYLANIAARAIQQTHPGKKIGILAYSWYSMPPPFELEPNIHVQLTRGLNAGSYTAEELYDMWSKRSRTLGVYEYYSYWQMDRNMIPGTWVTDLEANAERIRQDVASGVVDISGQASDTWGIHGLAYYIANRLMWDSDADVEALRQDFMDKSFGPAAAPMSRYFHRVSHAANPMPGVGLLSQCIDDVQEASRLAAGAPAALARIDDIKKLIIFSYFGEKTAAPASSFVGIKMREGTDWEGRRQAFLDWFTWAYRIRNSHMISWLDYKNTVGRPISKELGDNWFWRNTVKSKEPNPWRDDTPITTAELDKHLTVIKREVGPLPGITTTNATPELTLVQLSDTPATATALPLSGKATWLIASLKGEPLRFTIITRPTVIKLGEGVAGVTQVREIVLEIPDARYSLSTQGGETLTTGKLALGSEALELVVPGPGVYRFTCQRGGAGWEAQFDAATPHALLLEFGQDKLDIVDNPGADQRLSKPAWFYVPKSTRELVLQAYQCGELVVHSPASAHAIPSDGNFVRLPVPAEEAGHPWNLTLSETVSRGRLRVHAIPTALTFTPRYAFVPQATATADSLTPLMP